MWTVQFPSAIMENHQSSCGYIFALLPKENVCKKRLPWFMIFFFACIKVFLAGQVTKSVCFSLYVLISVGFCSFRFAVTKVFFQSFWKIVYDFCFVHPIFASFDFWYFGHFSWVIIFPVFFCLAHLALQNVNKDYVIFLYFRNFVAKSDQKPKRKMGWTEHLWRSC